VIVYNPLDGDAFTTSIPSNPRHCFLMTRIGHPIPEEVEEIRRIVTEICNEFDYKVIDAATTITGRDFLLKIWKLIASTPLSVAIVCKDLSMNTLGNIYYEIGVAQALGKETVIVKSQGVKVPSDFVRTEYIEFNGDFHRNFTAYFQTLIRQAEHYELVADQLERNPILAIDYLKRAFLIKGDTRLREKARQLLNEARLEDRAKNSVEILAATF